MNNIDKIHNTLKSKLGYKGTVEDLSKYLEAPDNVSKVVKTLNEKVGYKGTVDDFNSYVGLQVPKVEGIQNVSAPSVAVGTPEVNVMSPLVSNVPTTPKVDWSTQEEGSMVKPIGGELEREQPVNFVGMTPDPKNNPDYSVINQSGKFVYTFDKEKSDRRKEKDAFLTILDEQMKESNKRLEESMAAVKKYNEENPTSGWENFPVAYSGAILAQHKIEKQKNDGGEPQGDIFATQVILKDAEQAFKAPKKGENWAKSFGTGGAETVTDPDAWLFGILSLNEVQQSMGVFEKVEKGEPLTDTESALMDAMLTRTQAEAMRSSDTSNWYKGGKVAGEALPFMRDMALTGGLNTITTAGGKGAVSLAQKATAKYLRKKAEKQLLKEGIDITEDILSRRAADLFMRTAKVADYTGRVLTSATVTPAVRTPLMATSYSGIAKNMQPKVVGDEFGTYQIQEGDDFGTAVGKQFVEVQSEGVGEFFAPILKGVKFLGGKAIPKVISDSKFGQVGSKVVDAIMLDNPYLQKAGVSGIAGEVGEEIFGQTEQYLSGLTTKEDLDNFYSGDNFKSMLIGFAPMSALGMAGNAINYGSNEVQYRRAKKELGGLTDELDNSSVGELGNKMLEVLVRNNAFDEKGNLTKEGNTLNQNMLSYAQRKMAKDIANDGKQENPNSRYYDFLLNDRSMKWLESYLADNDLTAPMYFNLAYKATLHENELTDYERKTLSELDRAFNGYLKAEDAAQQASAEIDAQVNPTNNKIQNVTIGGQPYTVKGGNIAMTENEEGKAILDKENSDQVITVVNAEGIPSQIGIEQLESVVGEVDADEAKNAAIESAHTTAYNETFYPVGSIVYRKDAQGQFSAIKETGADGFTINSVTEGGEVVPTLIENTNSENFGVISLKAGDKYTLNDGTQLDIISNEGGVISASVNGQPSEQTTADELATLFESTGIDLAQFEPVVEDVVETPELANQVYEALGFTGNISDEQKQQKEADIERRREEDRKKILKKDVYAKSVIDDIVSKFKKATGITISSENYGNLSDGDMLSYSGGIYGEDFTKITNRYSDALNVSLTNEQVDLLLNIAREVHSDIVHKEYATGLKSISFDKYDEINAKYDAELANLNTQITPEQKQEAQKLYSQYLEQGGSQGDIQGFKEFVHGKHNSVKPGVEESFEETPETEVQVPGVQVEETQVTEQPEATYPTDKKGEPIFEQMPVEQSVKVVREVLGDDAVNFVEDKLKAANKAAKSVSKKTPKSTSLLGRKAEVEAIALEKQKAAESLDYWTNVKRLMSEEAIQATREQTPISQVVENPNQVGQVIIDRYESAKKVIGNTATITAPNGEVLKGRYVLVSAYAVTPSHNPFDGYNTSEGFPLNADGSNTNDRDYKNDKANQVVTEGIGSSFDGRALEKVPKVSKKGAVLDGNGTTMGSQLAAANGTDKAYLEALNNNAANYGFTAADLKSVSNPRIVFELETELPYTTEAFAMFNSEEKKSESATASAVAKSKQLSPSAVAKIAALVDSYSSLESFFSSETATAEMVKTLVDAKVINTLEIAKLIDNGLFSATGRELITNVLLGATLNEQAIRQIGNDSSLKGIIVRAMKQILENAKLKEYSLFEDLNNAIGLMYEARKAKMAVSEFLLQTNMFEKGASERFSDFEQMLALAMSDSGVLFKGTIDKYNTVAAPLVGGQVDMFTGRIMDPNEVKQQIIEYYGKTKSIINPNAGVDGRNRSSETARTDSGRISLESAQAKFDAAITTEEMYKAALEITLILDEQNNTTTIVAKDNEEFISMLPAKYAEAIRKERVMGVFFKGQVIINSEKFDTGEELLLTYEHEWVHNANKNVHSSDELAELWDNSTDKKILPRIYLGSDDKIKGDELIAHIIEDIIQKQGYENYKNGNIDLSLYSQQEQLKKTIDYANKEYLRNVRGGDSRGNLYEDSNARKADENLQQADEGRQTPKFRQKDAGTSGQVERNVQENVSQRGGRVRKAVTTETLLIDGVERPTRNSNGAYIHSTEEGVRNFYAWFGDSKVVDAEGRPLVVYHGGASNITQFDAQKAGAVKYSDWGKGIYFTPSEMYADMYRADYAKSTDDIANRLYDEYVEEAKKLGTTPMDKSIDLGYGSEKYKYLSEYEQKWRNRLNEVKNTQGEVYPVYLNISNPLLYRYEGITDPFLSEQAISNGNDGIIVTPMTEYIAFSPSQIKSATDNTGEFSPETGDIRFKMAYHGSPHNFDKFSTSKIGYGEGVQAYGWGLYFTDKKEIAEDYAKMKDLDDNFPVIGEEIIDNRSGIDRHRIFRLFEKYNGNKNKIANDIEGYAKILELQSGWPREIQAPIERRLAERIRKEGIRLQRPRNLYTVKIHGDKTIDELNFMRWDKPITKKQQDAIKWIFDELVNAQTDYKLASELSNKLSKYDFENKTGQDIYKDISAIIGTPKDDADKKASLMLLDYGIDGIQYPTEYLSKGAHKGDYNYVVFDENVIEIEDHIRFKIAKSQEELDDFVKDSKVKETVYHATSADFDEFDISKSANGTIWFSMDKESTLDKQQSGKKATRIIEAKIKLKNPAGWDEYEKYSIDELIREGYDGAILDEDAFVFSPEQVLISPADNADIRFKIEANKIDSEYFAAIERGDMDEAQRIVDQQAVKKGYISNTDYRMMHQAPNREDHRASELMDNDVVPSDYWTHPQYYQYERDEFSSFYKIKAAIEKAKEGKTSKVWMYRAIPKNIKDDNFRNGDWITPSREYAQSEGLGITEGYRIITQRVDLNDLWWDANSINEFGFDDGKEYAYKNTKNNRKLTDVITRDYDGNIIPPSKRFNNREYDPRFSIKSPIGFYSTVENALDKIQQDKGTKEQFQKMLLNNGAKQAEMDWMGFGELPEKLTKSDIQNWIDENRIEVKEVVKGQSKISQSDLDRIDELTKLRQIRRFTPEESKEFNELNDRAQSGVADNTKFSQYVLPGGENYMELLLIMPSKKLPAKAGDTERIKLLEEKRKSIIDNGNYEQKEVDDINTQIAVLSHRVDKSKDFRGNHYDEPNILAHIRFDERTVNGERVLFIQEFQSDWAQTGKKKGFANSEAEKRRNEIKSELETLRNELNNLRDKDAIENGNGVRRGDNLRDWTEKYQPEKDKRFSELLSELNDIESKYEFAVPDMPFKKTDQWVNLAARRMMRYAAENGFDRIAWTNGEQQVDRYNLSKQVNEIEYAKSGNKYDLRVRDKRDNPIVKGLYSENELEDIVGKEIAKKIVEGEGKETVDKTKSLTGLDLKVGGEGMKIFYDAIVPSAMSKLGKPFGAKVENVEIDTDKIIFPYTLENTTVKESDKIKGDYLLLNENGDYLSRISVTTPTRLTPKMIHQILLDRASRRPELQKLVLSTQQSIPVTESMKESVMEGVPLFAIKAPKFEKGASLKEMVATSNMFIAARADKYGAKGRRMVESEIKTVGKAINEQSANLKESANLVTDMVKALLNNGSMNYMTRAELSQILTNVRNASNKKDLTKEFDKISSIVRQIQLRNAKRRFNDLMKFKVQDKNAKGISIASTVDDETVSIITTIRKSLKELTLEDVENQINEINNLEKKTTSDEIKLVGLSIARDYMNEIKTRDAQLSQLAEESSKAKEGLVGKKGKDRLIGTQLVNSIEVQIGQVKAEMTSAYDDLSSRLNKIIAEGKEALKNIKLKDKENVEEIKHDVNSDMKGIIPVNNPPIARDFKQWLKSNFIVAPLQSFDYMLRSLAPNQVAGDGYLHDRFARGILSASQNAYEGTESAFKMIDEAVAKIFGDKFTFRYVSARDFKKMSKYELTYGTEKSSTIITATNGQLAYIYAVNKMTDGAMKLRAMGISEEQVEEMKAALPVRIVKLVDAIQDEILPKLRVKYNNTHLEIFNTSMDAIENYFPLKIDKTSLHKKMDLEEESTYLSGLIKNSTNSIIKRKVNTRPIDIRNSDFADVLTEHIKDMEEWSAYAKIRRDLNILLSNSSFTNRLIAIGGFKYLVQFKRAAAVAANVYQPSSDTYDTAITGVARNFATSKVVLNPYTALKQVLSIVSYLTEPSAAFQGRVLVNLTKGHQSFKWAYNNLPEFRKRWESSALGDEKLGRQFANIATEGDFLKFMDASQKFVQKYGMLPNKLVDSYICAVGAKSLYETNLKKYEEMSLTEEQARERALIDGSNLYNTTQQSSEGLYVSSIQMDRTFFSTAYTVFNNSSIAYSRQVFDAARNLKNAFNNRANLIENRTKFNVRTFNISEEAAKKAAVKEVDTQIMRDVLRLAVFGYSVQFIWRLGASFPYLLFGDDDDKKKKIAKEAATGGALITPIRGLLFGATFESVIDGLMEWLETGSSYAFVNRLTGNIHPIISDVDQLARAAVNKNMNLAKAGYLLVNLGTKLGWGMDLKPFANATYGFVSLIDSDELTANDVVIDIMSMLSVPQSQLKALALDNPETFFDRYIELKELVDYGLLAPILELNPDDLDNYIKSGRRYMRRDMKEKSEKQP